MSILSQDRVHKLLQQYLSEVSGAPYYHGGMSHHCFPSRVILVTFVSQDAVTKFRIDFEETGVRATSLVCLLGLGLGLGSLLLYKLCRSLFGRSPSPTNHTLSSQCHGDIQTPSSRHSSPVHVTSCRSKRSIHGQTSLDRPSPDTPSDSGISSMGNYQSDTSAAVSPDSGYPAAIYNTSGGVRFRGFRKDDRVLEEERDPLVNGSPSGQSRSEDDDSDETGTGDDETRGLLSGRRKARRSPSTIRRQLTIDIPLDDDCAIRYHRTLSSASSDFDANHLESSLQRDTSFDGQSLGGFSLMPNFSPTSLHEKNLRLVDDEPGPKDAKSEEKGEVVENGDGETSTESSRRKSESSRNSVSCASELTSCTTHPLQSPNSPVSTNESGSSHILDGSGSTQSEYLSSEPRSRSLSPEIMNIFAKYRSGLDHSSTNNPDGAHHSMNGHHPTVGATKEHSDESPVIKHRSLKHSLSSLSSVCSSVDISSRDLTLRAHSLDLTENPSDLGTPDSEFFNPGDVGLKTAASMEHIQNELRHLEMEIAEMNTTFQVLNSRENLTIDADQASGSKDSSTSSSFLRVLQRHKSREEGLMTRSLSMFDEKEELEELEQEKKKWRHSYHHSGQYVWDFQSDIGSSITPPTRKRFVDHWMTLDDSGENSRDHSGAQSPSFEHVRSYLRQSVDSSAGSDIPHNSSLADLYIDDDLSGLVNSETQQLRLHGQSDTSSLNSGEQTFSSNSDHEIPFSPIKSMKDNTSREMDQIDGKCLKQEGGEGRLFSVGPRRGVVEYAEQEWRGQTDRASTMRKGYSEIEKSLGFHHLRRIRGDNYCALRATLFQILTAGIKPAQSASQLDNIKQKLEVFRDSDHKHLQQDWTFGGRLCRGQASVYETADRCLHKLITKVESIQSQDEQEGRERAAEELLNSDEETDLLLMEAIKLLMLFGAMDLHRLSLTGADVPTFVMLMFARDSSSTLQSFVKNHLNTVGSSGGLEQIEMFLLSHVLGVIIKVIRPSQYGESDFVTVYSEESEASSAPSITLIAEDDRHYNVLL